jgi:hypothetical protein
MRLAKQPATFPAVHAPIDCSKSLSTRGFRTKVIIIRPLPMRPCNYFVRIRVTFRRRCVVAGERCWREDGDGRWIVRFKHVKSFEFLVDNCQRLKLFRFQDLLVEPSFDFILLDRG